MPIITTSLLNKKQKKQLEALLLACKKYEPLTLTFPTEDADLYVLYEEQDKILSACALTKEYEETYECLAFTAPECRRQGMFSELFDTALELLPEDIHFLFYTDQKSPDTQKTLAAYEAEPLFHEYMMELSDFSALHSDSAMSVSMKESIEDGTHTLRYQSPYGVVNFSVFSSYYYLYGFEILEEFRGKGYGHAMLCEVLNILRTRNSMPVRLQVSGENLPAFSLYKKVGFQITETLSCYIY